MVHKEKDRLRWERSWDRYTPEQKRVIARFLEFMALKPAGDESTNLSSTGWTPLSPAITASAATTRLALPFDRNSHGFCRLVLLP